MTLVKRNNSPRDISSMVGMVIRCSSSNVNHSWYGLLPLNEQLKWPSSQSPEENYAYISKLKNHNQFWMTLYRVWVRNSEFWSNPQIIIKSDFVVFLRNFQEVFAKRFVLNGIQTGAPEWQPTILTTRPTHCTTWIKIIISTSNKKNGKHRKWLEIDV